MEGSRHVRRGAGRGRDKAAGSTGARASRRDVAANPAVWEFRPGRAASRCLDPSCLHSRGSPGIACWMLRVPIPGPHVPRRCENLGFPACLRNSPSSRLRYPSSCRSACSCRTVDAGPGDEWGRQALAWPRHRARARPASLAVHGETSSPHDLRVLLHPLVTLQPVPRSSLGWAVMCLRSSVIGALSIQPGPGCDVPEVIRHWCSYSDTPE